MTAAKAIVLMAALKKAAGRPSVRPANEADANQISATEATALMEALKEAVEVKKTVQVSKTDLTRDRRVPSERSVVINHWDFLNSGGEPGWYLERAARDQGRDEGDREPTTIVIMKAMVVTRIYDPVKG